MLTGHTELSRVMEARDAGVHEFLAKLISAKGLYSRIRSIIEHPRPFVRTSTYFGPDRRRRQIEWKGKERRRIVTPDKMGQINQIAKEHQGEALSQAEVEALLGG